ncbi:MAG: hypothetical protein IJT68_01170 [Lentisphaeria bacterium]|nr:hypothetical protein [Lentisphaeria bacterium]
MLQSLFRGGRILAASLCAVFFASCGVTPLLYPPVDDNTSAEMFDAEASAALLKAGTLKSADGDIAVVFSEYKTESKDIESAVKKSFDGCAVRGMLTMVDNDKEKGPVESWLPVVVVPFRQGDSLFYFMALDNLYIMEKTKLNPEYVFMMKPYSYILKAEPKDGGWEVGFVQFATTGLEVKKVTDKTQIDKDGTVLNPPAEVLEMLKDPKTYEIVAKMTFLPVKSEEAKPAQKQ